MSGPSLRLLLVLPLVFSCTRSTPRPEAPADPPPTVSSAPTPAAEPPAPAESTPPAAAPPPTVDSPAATPPKVATVPTPPPAAPRATRPAPVASAPAPTPAPQATPAAQDPAPMRDAYHRAPADTVDARTYQGWKYYNLNCARCHGEDVTGTTIAPHLIASLKPTGATPNEAEFLKVVCSGRVEKGMPAWCAQGMSTAQIDTIYAYVKARSDARMGPGRPARRGG